MSEAERILAELAERNLTGEFANWLSQNQGLLRALRGDVAGAIAIFDEQSEEANASEYVHDRASYFAGRALVSLVAGDLESAHDEAAAAVAADPSGINSPKALAIQARAALWLGDPHRASAALDGLRGFHGRWVTAVRVTIEAGIAALASQIDAALTAYEHALRAWTELEIPLDLALCEMDIAFLLGDHPAALEAMNRAGEALGDIGAPPLLRQLETAVAARH